MEKRPCSANHTNNTISYQWFDKKIQDGMSKSGEEKRKRKCRGNSNMPYKDSVFTEQS